MPLSDWAKQNEDLTWTGVDGEVYPSLSALFDQLVSQWRTVSIGLTDVDKELEEMREELGFLTAKETEKKELKDLSADLKEVLQEIVLMTPEKIHGTTKQNR